MRQLYTVMGLMAQCKAEIRLDATNSLEAELIGTFAMLIWRNAIRHLDGLPCKASTVACYLLSQGEVIDNG